MSRKTAVIGAVVIVGFLCAIIAGFNARFEYAVVPDRSDLLNPKTAPIEQVYEFWRNFTNFPRFMRHIESVEMLGDRRSRWRAAGPGGRAWWGRPPTPTPWL